MRVIDWEYGGMNGGYYDIACVCVENPLQSRHAPSWTTPAFPAA